MYWYCLVGVGDTPSVSDHPAAPNWPDDLLMQTMRACLRWKSLKPTDAVNSNFSCPLPCCALSLTFVDRRKIFYKEKRRISLLSLISASEQLDYQFLENAFIKPKPGGKVRLDSTIGWPLKIVNALCRVASPSLK